MHIFLTVLGPFISVVDLIGTQAEHLQSRHNPRFWGAVLLPLWLYDSIPVILLYAGLEAMLVYCNAFTVAMGSITCVQYAVLTLTWIRQLRTR